MIGDASAQGFAPQLSLLGGRRDSVTQPQHLPRCDRWARPGDDQRGSSMPAQNRWAGVAALVRQSIGADHRQRPRHAAHIRARRSVPEGAARRYFPGWHAHPSGTATCPRHGSQWPRLQAAWAVLATGEDGAADLGCRITRRKQPRARRKLSACSDGGRLSGA